MLVTSVSKAPHAEFVEWERGETLGSSCSVNGSLAAEEVHNIQVTIHVPHTGIFHNILY